MSFFIEFLDGFLNGFFYQLVRLHLVIHIIERKDARLLQPGFVKSPRFAHLAAQAVSIHGMLEERFGCPDEHLRTFRMRDIGYT